MSMLILCFLAIHALSALPEVQAERLEPPDKNIQPEQFERALFFDFDLTLSNIHVFSTLREDDLCGWTACTEAFLIDWFTPAIKESVFGDQARLADLTQLFTDATTKFGCKVFVVSHGFESEVKQLLDLAGLGLPDEQVKGRSPEEVEGNKMFSKANFIKEKLQNLGISSPSHGMLVDDDPKNIDEVQQGHVCQTQHVKERKGMTTDDITKVRQWLEEPEKNIHPEH